MGRFRDKSIGGETLKESDSNESKSSSSESGALSSSNLDTEDEDGRNISFDANDKKYTPKSHQKAKKNKMGKVSNKTRQSTYVVKDDNKGRKKHGKVVGKQNTSKID